MKIYRGNIALKASRLRHNAKPRLLTSPDLTLDRGYSSRKPGDHLRIGLSILESHILLGLSGLHKHSLTILMRTWIKICGTTCIEDALASIAAGADALGFIFAPSQRQISASQAQDIVRQLPPNIESIGVFRNEAVASVAQMVEQVGLTSVQLHGDETPAFIAAMKAILCPQRKIGVIKTVLVNDDFERRFAEVCAAYDNIDSILLDSGGGSGRTFDWQKAQPLLANNRKPLIMAGGLNIGNIEEAIRTFTPWGVDVVSGVERAPGRKDSEKLRAFVAAIRRTQPS